MKQQERRKRLRKSGNRAQKIARERTRALTKSEDTSAFLDQRLKEGKGKQRETPRSGEKRAKKVPVIFQ